MSNNLRALKRDAQKRKPQDSVSEVELGRLVGSQNSINNILGQVLPARLSYRISLAIRKLQPEMDAYESARQELCQKFGRLNEEAGKYEFENGQRQEFDKELAELMRTKVKLNFEPLRIGELDRVELSAADMLNLSWLITE